MPIKIYELKHQYQTCFDDGGVGHDSWWQDSKYTFEASTNKEAKEIADKFIRDRDGKHPCNGSFCDNRGGYRFVSLNQLIPEKRLAVK